MTIAELSRRLIAAHEATEYFLAGVEEAVADCRFKLTLADNRKLRDLANDIENMASKAGAESIKIPAELPKNGFPQKVQLARSVKSPVDGK